MQRGADCFRCLLYDLHCVTAAGHPRPPGRERLGSQMNRIRIMSIWDPVPLRTGRVTAYTRATWEGRPRDGENVAARLHCFDMRRLDLHSATMRWRNDALGTDTYCYSSRQSCWESAWWSVISLVRMSSFQKVSSRITEDQPSLLGHAHCLYPQATDAVSTSFVPIPRCFRSGCGSRGKSEILYMVVILSLS